MSARRRDAPTTTSRATRDTHLVPTTAPGHTVLAMLVPGRSHAVQLHWDMPEWRFRQWCVNLQTPFELTRCGIRSTDRFLDIVVDPSLNWRWKDEDEVEEAVRVGRLTIAEAAAIRNEGERVIADIEAVRPPFSDAYTRWRPDQVWEVPPAPIVWIGEPAVVLCGQFPLFAAILGGHAP